MTHKEIHEFLANTKVYVNGKSKEIQEKLFSFGWSWPGCTKTKYEGEPFLFIYEYLSLKHGCDMLKFTKHAHREISAEEILSLELTEPAYRPFRTQEECWEEMHKHPDFAWIRRNINGAYVAIQEVGNHIDSVSFEDIFKTYTFTDGEPFGIKEE